jgi:hypothetical protein
MPETLMFSVHDPDVPAIERYNVSIRWPAAETQTALDSSRQFKVILSPKTVVSKTKDTVRISVSDKAGHKDSLAFFITYANAMSAAFSGTIFINTRTSGIYITQPVVQFPLLVRLSSSYFPFDEVSKDGRDIRFKKPDGTPLPYEVERWDSAGGIAEIWVNVDTILPKNETQNIKMFWGNPALLDSSSGKEVFGTASSYIGVWHMQDAESGTNKNSCQDNFAATPIGSSGINGGSGIVAYADSFAQNKYLTVGSLSIQKNITVSAWINPQSYVAGSKIICQELPSNMSPYTYFSLETKGAYPAQMHFKIGYSSSNYANAASIQTIPLQSWSYVTGTYDGSTIRFYLNGTLTASTAISGNLPQTGTPFTIASSDIRPMESFTGLIDEVRVCNQAMNSDYVKLSYENQRLGSALVQFK